MALVNVTQSRCHLRGWPRVQLLGGRVQPMRVRTLRIHRPAAGAITIGTWQRVYFTIHYTGAGPCLPKHQVADGVRITAPGSTGGLIVPAPLDICALTRPIEVAIDPFRANRTPVPSFF